MSATCAACLGPIAKGQPFVLEGTEVFHRTRRCVAAIERSNATQLKLAVQKLRSESLSLRQEAANERIKAQHLDTTITDLKQEIARLKTDRTNETERVRTEQAMRRSAERSYADVGQRHRETLAQLDAMRAENARLQAELLRRATDQLPVPQESDHRDPTEIRFSLLELDGDDK